MSGPGQQRGRPLRTDGLSTSDRLSTRSNTRLLHQLPVRPDLWDVHYPDPRCNFRSTMFGLTLDQYRAEYRRRQAEGWAAWELAVRFPHPDAVAA